MQSARQLPLRALINFGFAVQQPSDIRMQAHANHNLFHWLQ